VEHFAVTLKTEGKSFKNNEHSNRSNRNTEKFH